MRHYRCPTVVLSHDCDHETDTKSSIPFALGARDLASLPTLVKKMADGIHATAKDVREAMTADLPVTSTELERLRRKGAVIGPPVLAQTLRIAREVVFIL